MTSSPTPSPIPPTAASSVVPQEMPARRRFWSWGKVVLISLTIVVALLAFRWIAFRRSHSITNDAFVESHIVNVAPEAVSGRIVRFNVEQNEHVVAGQILAEVDPVPYRDHLSLAQAKLSTAQQELKRQEIAMARLKVDVPLQMAIARQGLVVSQLDFARAEETLKVTDNEVERNIEAAQAGLDAAKADSALAQIEYDRYADLYQENAVPQQKWQQVTRARDSAAAHVRLSEAKLAQSIAERGKVEVARKVMEEARAGIVKAMKNVDLADSGQEQIAEVEQLTVVKRHQVDEAQQGVNSAEHNLSYTQIRAPIPGVIVRRARNLGDYVSPGTSILSLYNPDLLYVTANLEETRLRGVAPGNRVQLDIDAFSEPFHGRVLWLNRTTGAEFSLLPRNVVSGEFTKVVQRVPVRIWIERDDRWPQLRAGLSVQVTIAHGPGDPDWAEQTVKEMLLQETQFHASADRAAEASTMSR